MTLNTRHCLSKIFQPIVNIPKAANPTRKDVTSNSQRLMLELGIIQHTSPGCFNFLPLGLKSMHKLIHIVDTEMLKIGGQKVLLSALTDIKLWQKSGRLNEAGAELFQLKDRHNHSYILSPTHEEVVSNLISSVPKLPHTKFPLKLYQISSKYRDEIKPRFGLMRGREFLMKDMYSFDIDEESAKKTYEDICQSYDNIFRKIDIDFVKVLGTSDNMGGTLSHEYHYKSPVGEDRILLCPNCNYAANAELCGSENCPNCGEVKINIQNAIEVGHTFFLGNKYSKPLKAVYVSKKGHTEDLQMGSYGIGLSRILAASVEVLSTEIEIGWPDVLAPYNVVIIPPKAGSKEEESTRSIAEELYTRMEDAIPPLKDNILLDDRINLTIGRRQLDAKRVGYRYIIVINQRCTEAEPIYEFNDTNSKVRLYMNETEIFNYIKQNTVL